MIKLAQMLFPSTIMPAPGEVAIDRFVVAGKSCEEIA